MPSFPGRKRAGRPKGEIVIIIALIFLSLFVFFLRSRNLDRLSLWMDEGFYVLAAQQILVHGYPLYPSGHVLFKGILYSYLLGLIGWLFGPSAVALRLVSVVASVLVLPLFYLLAKKIVSPGLAFLGVLLVAFSSWETEYSRTAIYFSLLQLCYLACLYLFHLCYLEEKKKYLIPMTIIFLLAPHVHQLAMGTLFSFVALFFLSGVRRFFRREVLLPLVVISASYLLIQIHELFFWKVGYVFEKQPQGLKEGLSYFFQGFTLGYFQEILRSFPRMGWVVYAGLFLYFGQRLYRRLAETQEKLYLDRWFFLNVNFFLPLVFFGFFRTHLQPRYLFQLHPLLILLFLVAVKEVSRIGIDLLLQPFFKGNKPFIFRPILTTGLLLILIISLSDQVSYKTTQRIVNRDYKERISTDVITRSGRTEHYDYRGVGLYVRNYLEPGDVVIAMHMVFQYIYGGQVDYWLWTGGPGTWDAWEKTAAGWRDVYVGAAWLNSLSALKEVISRREQHRVWLVTSPSIYRRDHISQEVADFILSQKEHLLFRGRDEMSEVYLWPKEGEEVSGGQPVWEAEWLPAAWGEVRFDPSASRGSYLRWSAPKAAQGKKDRSWKNPVLPGNYRLELRLRTVASQVPGRDGQLEITLRTKKTRLVLFSRVIKASELQPEGRWVIKSSEVIVPPAEEFWLSVSFRGKETIDWDYLDLRPLKDIQNQ